MTRLPPLLIVFLWLISPAKGADRVDVSSLIGKVVCGYQGWFRCEGDGANNGWHHYAAGGKFAPGFSHIEMWPDVSELPPAERISTPFRFADGSTAEVFSSAREPVVALHFQWMREYGIDGAFLQRFATTARDKRFREPMDRILDYCKASAAKNGRGWALMYDLSGIKPGGMESVLEDWKRLIRDRRIVRDKSDSAYFHHKGKPIVALWGLGFSDREPMLDEWDRLLTFLRDNPEFGGFSIMLGVPYHWRTQDGDAIADPRLQAILSKADILSPWSVGRLATPQDAAARVEKRLRPDIARAAELGADYLPVIFPGFSWQNLSKSRGKEAKFDAIPRLGGKFLWAQATAAKHAGAKMLYVAMFDELDEATAIFKTLQTPPIGESQFIAEPTLRSDHYLWLTGRIGRLLRGEVAENFPARYISGSGTGDA
jgi:hypothetical protein